MKAYLEIEMPACINCRFCQAGDSTSYCLAQSHELEHGGWYMHNIKWDEGIGYEAQKTWREKTCPLVPVPSHWRPVVRGKWLNDFCGKGRFSKRIVQCSLCGNFLDLDGVNAGRGDANYCPNCGADMREDI